MPDTPGKRQRREVKTRKRQAKEDRRAARHALGDASPTDEPVDDLGAPLDDRQVTVVLTEPETDGPEPEEVTEP